MNSLISIVIPVFNRAEIIKDTLDSISKQTYSHWECLIVDDGSSDSTRQVVNDYIKQDGRFQYYTRPINRPKGANACRNYGLELANGSYIVFFDSDDLMTSNHLEVKFRAISESDSDFVITQTRYFNNDALNKALKSQYDFKLEDITLYNFVRHKVVWLTLDVCIKNKLAKTIRFNENLQSGQEYNYFSKLLSETNNCIVVDKVISLRRHHDNSIRGKLRKDRIESSLGFFMTYWYTFQDLRNHASKKVLRFLLYRCYRLALKMPKTKRPFKSALNNALRKAFGFKGVYYVCNLTFKTKAL